MTGTAEARRLRKSVNMLPSETKALLAAPDKAAALKREVAQRMSEIRLHLYEPYPKQMAFHDGRQVVGRLGARRPRLAGLIASHKQALAIRRPRLTIRPRPRGAGSTSRRWAGRLGSTS